MDPVRLPRSSTLAAEGGYWQLCWNEHVIGLRGSARSSPPSQTRIAPATGPGARTEIDARRLAQRYLVSKLPSGVLAERSQMTVTDFIEAHFLPEIIARKAFAWRAHYKSVLKHIVSPKDIRRLLGVDGTRADANFRSELGWPYLGHLRLGEVRSDHVDLLTRTALERGYSPRTVRHIRSVISALFTYAKQELMFTGTNPARSAQVPEIDRKSETALTLEQMEQALRVMRYPEKQMTIIALLTDMNVSEICGLQWKCVNLTGGWLDLDKEVIPPLTIAVTKRWYRGELAEVKETRRRMIHIPATLLPMLLLIGARNEFSGPEDFVLTSRSGTAINVSNITARRLCRIGKKLGIQELTLRTFRRTQGLIEQRLGAQFQHRIGAAIAMDI